MWALYWSNSVYNAIIEIITALNEWTWPQAALWKFRSDIRKIHFHRKGCQALEMIAQRNGGEIMPGGVKKYVDTALKDMV